MTTSKKALEAENEALFRTIEEIYKQLEVMNERNDLGKLRELVDKGLLAYLRTGERK